MIAIKTKKLTKKYKDKIAVKEIDLSIKRGEIFALLGVNGAGKTTLIKILCGLTRKTSGTITINNFNLDKEIDKIKEIIDISPQETSVANNLNVKENLEFMAGVYQIINKEENGKSNNDIRAKRVRAGIVRLPHIQHRH